MDDDDQEEAGTIGTSRYPCMPSLIALQQMKNRLHLAFLGKKLMKWTAQATGREQRKLAWNLIATSKNFSEDMTEAFMLLARGRYFCPNLNKMVIENIGQASLRVEVKPKSISGVKVLNMVIVDTGADAYQHLGIEKGGQAILEAKEAWRKLLKRLILMLEQRISFSEVDIANRSATKKMNVIAKIVIPRTHLSIKYIKEALEEVAREEFYRLKMILEHKKRARRLKANEEKKKELEIKCSICVQNHSTEELLKIVDDETKEDLVKAESNDDTLLEVFKDHISEIVKIAREISSSGLLSATVDDFLKSAEELQESLEQLSHGINAEPISSDYSVKELCEVCKERLQENKNDVTESTEQEHCCKILSEEDDDLELGIFETEIQEITKIVRVMNKDGTVNEERKVIKIKKEKKTSLDPKQMSLSDSHFTINTFTSQTSGTSKKSASFDDHKTVEFITVKKSKPRAVKARSAFIDELPTMADPLIRNCLSTICFRSLDSSSINDETISFEFKELVASSPNFEETLKLFEQRSQNSDEVIIKYKEDDSKTSQG